MSAFPEYIHYDGLGLAELVCSGQVTPGELVEEAIQRIETLNPQLNAVVTTMYDQARSAVEQGLPHGPFHGVPFLLKDLVANYAGVPTSSGNRLLKNVPMPRDSEMVRRFKAAGLVIVGKTNTSEFGVYPFTEPEAFGPTHNPWDLSRTPGGSSGGSAAAVAAGLVALASGQDGGGSIRIPAACCGLFGLKPTRGRTPTGPDMGEAWHGFDIEHVLTRSVRDSAAMLDATAGADVGAPYAAPHQAGPFLREVTRNPGRLRIAFTSHPFLGEKVHADCREGLGRTVTLLEALGHELHEDAPQVDADELARNFLAFIAAECRVDMALAAAAAGRRVTRDGFETVTYALGLLGKSLGAVDHEKAIRYLQLTARSICEFFERYDVLLTPTAPTPPVPIGALQPTRAEMALLRVLGRLNAGWLMKTPAISRPMAAHSYDFIGYTIPFNVTGQPAMSVPLHWNEAGLPIGMHFVGRFGDEAMLFRLAGQLERAQPWADRLPVVATD